MFEETTRIRNNRKTSNSNSVKQSNFDEYTKHINEIRKRIKREQSKFEKNKKSNGLQSLV